MAIAVQYGTPLASVDAVPDELLWELLWALLWTSSTNRQDWLFSQPHLLSWTRAFALQVGAEPLLDELELFEEPELPEELELPELSYLQDRLFSQPQPPPLFIAADEQVGAVADRLTTQERPFSKPQSPLISAEAEQTG